jgi:FKBP-type peptidyl-prolyl cis-trans isomerase
MPERVELSKPGTSAKPRVVRAPRFVSSALFVMLGLPACGRTGAVPPQPAPAPASAPASAPGADASMSRVGLPPPPVDVATPPPDAEHEPSGVARKILARGKGTEHPPATSYVDLHYSGWERNGHQFEGSAVNGPPGRYQLKDLADGLRDELAQMVEGDRRRIWVPSALAYGKRETFVNAPRGDMTFDVELVRIVPVPSAPPDLKEPPKGAKTTKSGLTYVVLKKGTGKTHPEDGARVVAEYAGWTPDGTLFQTSVAGGDMVHVRVNRLPPGWREAMKLMVEGDKWRLWLPGKLAFGDLAPGQERLPFGPPPGPVVMDVELVKIAE